MSYRLAPKWTLTHQVIDCKLALRWIIDNGSRYGADITNIYVAGGSAGGHLSSLLATTPNAPRFQPGNMMHTYMNDTNHIVHDVLL